MFSTFHINRLNVLTFNKCPGHWAKNIPLFLLSSLGSKQSGQRVALQCLFHSQYQPLHSQVPIYTPG